MSVVAIIGAVGVSFAFAHFGCKWDVRRTRDRLSRQGYSEADVRFFVTGHPNSLLDVGHEQLRAENTALTLRCGLWILPFCATGAWAFFQSFNWSS